MNEELQRNLNQALALPDSDLPMGKALVLLLTDAGKAGVSDVHLNPSPKGLDILYRIDGALLRKARIAPNHAEQFLRKIMVLSGLLTYKAGVPQDGQIPADKFGGKTDIRVSFFPTIHGEKAVLRFFLHAEEKFELEDLGLDANVTSRLREHIARPDGVILLTGPSGSGKTTTIYSLLNEIASPEEETLRHVVTIEDPVENEIEGITQTQVNPEGGLTFAYSLRSLLRQDPQVIMVGEIRDRETARVAMEAGLTGHLVISTIHSGTAAGVVARLIEMGVEPHVLTASLSCVLAQRLVRKKCQECENGCTVCNDTGFSGRKVFSEFLEVDDKIRKAISNNSSRDEIENLAIEAGMKPLRQVGENLIESGITIPQEIRRVLG